MLRPKHQFLSVIASRCAEQSFVRRDERYTVNRVLPPGVICNYPPVFSVVSVTQTRTPCRAGPSEVYCHHHRRRMPSPLCSNCLLVITNSTGVVLCCCLYVKNGCCPTCSVSLPSYPKFVAFSSYLYAPLHIEILEPCRRGQPGAMSKTRAHGLLALSYPLDAWSYSSCSAIRTHYTPNWVSSHPFKSFMEDLPTQSSPFQRGPLQHQLVFFDPFSEIVVINKKD